MKTVLFLPMGLGLAHTGRLIMVARELRKKGLNIKFGAGTDAPGLLDRENIPYDLIPEFPKKIYNTKMKHNNFFVYSKEIIEDFVNAELKLYSKIKPDLIVYDTRLTAKISAEIAGIRTVSILNANMTPYYDFSKIKLSMDTVFSKFLPDGALKITEGRSGQEFFRRVGPLLIQSTLILELIRMSPHLVKLGYKIKRNPYQFLLGDWTLMTDIPEYRPVTELPLNVKMIGPIFWDGGLKRSGQLKSFGNRKAIYVTAGGTGDKKLFNTILDYLKDMALPIVATTGNTLRTRDVKISYPNLFLSDFLQGASILRRSKLAIFPGGNATCYQALTFGVPQVLTPLHIDQEDNANQLERLGSGIMINPKKGFTKYSFLTAVNEVMTNPAYKKNAQAVAKILKNYNGPLLAAETITKLISGSPENAIM